MAALTAERDTPCMHHEYPINFVQKGNTKIFNGALVAADANGYAIPASDTANIKILGRAQQTADATASGPNGVLADGVGNLDVMFGVFQYDTSGANALTLADVGGLAYVLDDHTVVKAAGTTNSRIAGKVLSVDVTNAKATIDTRQHAI